MPIVERFGDHFVLRVLLDVSGPASLLSVSDVMQAFAAACARDPFREVLPADDRVAFETVELKAGRLGSANVRFRVMRGASSASPLPSLVDAVLHVVRGDSGAAALAGRMTAAEMPKAVVLVLGLDDSEATRARVADALGIAVDRVACSGDESGLRRALLLAFRVAFDSVRGEIDGGALALPSRFDEEVLIEIEE